jgi:tetratricopeptide (TPR) repeat protein
LDKWVEETEKQAVVAEREHKWREASDYFLAIAYYYKDKKMLNEAANYFMRAGVAGERCEDWRKLGYIWAQCGSALEAQPTTAVSDVYDSLEASKHYFPTLDFVAWKGFSLEDKIGRAYRNAGYHFEKAGSNQSAYIQYVKAAHAFLKAGKLDEASRSFYLALISFIDRNGEINNEILITLETVNRRMIKESGKKYLKRCQLYYRILAGRLTMKGNFADANKLFIKESEVTRLLFLKERRLLKWLAYTLWRYSCRYGNSFLLWAAWAAFLFAALFPTLFWVMGGLIWQQKTQPPTWFDYLYFSLATVTSGGDSSFVLTKIGKGLAILEIGIGLLMLGALVTLLAKKLIR